MKIQKRIKEIYKTRRERGQGAQHALAQAKLQDAWDRAEARERAVARGRAVARTINGTKQ